METVNLGKGGGDDPPWNNLDLVEAENQNDFFIGFVFCSFYPPENVITLFSQYQ